MMFDVIVPVHNGADIIGKTLSALLRQEGIRDGCHRIIVVDDGSTDGTARVVESFDHDVISLVRLSQRGGRARACNAGAAGSDADALLFLDADCRPATPGLIHRHKHVLSTGFDLSFGAIAAEGTDFWSRYARVVAAERAARVMRADFAALTSCNLALSRDFFERIGGFCETYNHYGFEDRDLIIRLLSAGARPHFDAEAVVFHEAGATVAALCDKMEVAGRHTSGVFLQRHPNNYKQMRFSRIDIRTAPWGRRLALQSAALSLPLVRRVAARLVNQEWLPLLWRVRVVRLAVGLAYSRGTAAAQLSD